LAAILLAATFVVTTPAAATTSVAITTFQGAWVSRDTYSPGEIVTYQGGRYLCLVSNTDVAPTTNGEDWELLGAPSPLVRDSTGKIVGAYLQVAEAGYSYDHVWIKAFSIPFAVAFTPSVLGANSAFRTLYFASSDCTGNPYLPSTADTALPLAGVGGMIAYVAGTATTIMTPPSYREIVPGGKRSKCYSSLAGALSLAPVVATYDLSDLNLVPPFSVQ
jgi:hypothetical protein